MTNSTKNLIAKLYNNCIKNYNQSINNLDLDKARTMLDRMIVLDNVIEKYNK